MFLEERFSKELKGTLGYITDKLMVEAPSVLITSQYFIMACLEYRDCLAYMTLSKCLSSVAMDIAQDSLAEKLRDNSMTSLREGREPIISDELKDFIPKGEGVTSNDVMLSILSRENKYRSFFANLGIDINFYKQNMVYGIREPEKKQKEVKEQSKEQKKQSRERLMNGPAKVDYDFVMKAASISSFTSVVDGSSMEGIIGRDNEMGRMFVTLGRMERNNVLVVGDEGVGKSSLCNNLAYMIANSPVPEFLYGKTVIRLNPSSLLSGCEYVGVYEKRMKDLKAELLKRKSYILLIDDVHVLVGYNKSSIDTVSPLVEILSNDSIPVVCSTTNKFNKALIESNPSLSGLFQTLSIEAPDVSVTLDILKGKKASCQHAHGVRYDNKVLKECVRLASRYLTGSRLPSSAIGLMDEAGVKALMRKHEEAGINETRKEMGRVDTDMAIALGDDDIEGYNSLKEEMEKLKETLSRKTMEMKAKTFNVNMDDLASLVFEKTGIPVNKVGEDERKSLSMMESRVKESVVGQDEAVEKVCRVIRRNRLGLGNQDKTLGTLIFLGKTGCGKTYLAKTLAKEIFGSEKALVRLDMSEYSDKISVNKLIGSAPGYVGYENGGQLTEQIKRKRRCVLLLDEIEKADTEVFNIFLQVFDEGRLTDCAGETVDFKDVLIILTSNVGAREASERGKGIGLVKEDGFQKEILSKSLKRRFPPEFINRLDDIIYFNSLGDDQLRSIIRLELDKVKGRVSSAGFTFSYDEDVVEHVFSKIGDERDYGARPVIRAIQDEVENAIADYAVENDCEGLDLKIGTKEGKIVVFC